METQPLSLCFYQLLPTLCQVCLCTPHYLKGELHWTHSLNRLHSIHYLFFFMSFDKKPFLWCTFLFFPPCRLAKKPLHLSNSILSSPRSHSFSHFPSSHTWCKKPWLALQVERKKKMERLEKGTAADFQPVLSQIPATGVVLLNYTAGGRQAGNRLIECH